MSQQHPSRTLSGQHLVAQLASQYSRLASPAPGVADRAALVVDTIRNSWDQTRTSWLLAPAAGRFPVLVDGASAIDWRTALRPAELRFVVALDGETSVETLIGDSNLDPLHAAQVLCALALLGAIRFEAQADRLLSTLPPANGADDLGDPFPHHDPLEAATAFGDGRAALREGHLVKAASDFARARALDPFTPLHGLYAAWAAFLLLDDSERIGVAIPELERRALAVLAEDRRVAFAHYVYGRLQLARGETEVALKALRMAARLDPDDLDAKRYCHVLEMRHAAGSGA